MTSLAALVATRPLRLGDRGEIVTVAQLALRSAGAELVLDGDFGRMTNVAVRRYQAAHALLSDGVIGPVTGRSLDETAAAAPPPAHAPLSSVLKDAPWLATMRAITGTREIPGPTSNPEILAWAKRIGEHFPEMARYALQLRDDDIAWCAHCAGYCLAIHDIRPPYKPGDDLASYLWALAFLKFGFSVPMETVGAIGVFEGHVTMIEGWTSTHLICRGGNQSNMVNVTSILKSRWRGSRWPIGWPLVLIPGLTTNLAPAGSTR